MKCDDRALRRLIAQEGRLRVLGGRTKDSSGRAASSGWSQQKEKCPGGVPEGPQRWTVRLPARALPAQADLGSALGTWSLSEAGPPTGHAGAPSGAGVLLGDTISVALSVSPPGDCLAGAR